MTGRKTAAELVDLTRDTGDEQQQQQQQQQIIVLDDSIVGHGPEVIDLSDDIVHIDPTDSTSTSTSSSSTSGLKRKLTSRPPERKRRALPPAQQQPQPPHSPDTSPKCPICIETYKSIKTRGCKVVVTRCGHLFCDPCLKKAFQANGRKCPKCRTSIAKSATSVIEVYDLC